MRRSSRRSGEPPVVVGEVGRGSALTIKLHGQRLAELRKAMEARMRSGISDGGTDSEEELSVKGRRKPRIERNRQIPSTAPVQPLKRKENHLNILRFRYTPALRGRKVL